MGRWGRGAGPHQLTADPLLAPAPPPVRDTDGGWLRRLVGYLLAYRRNVVLAFGAAVVGTLAAVLTPLVERAVVDNVVDGGDHALAPYVLLLLVAGTVRFGAGYVRRYIGGRLALDVQYDLRDGVFTALERLDGARRDELATGQLVSRASSDITLVQGLLAFLPNTLGNLLLFVLSLIVMAVLSPLLTLVALAVGPVLGVIAYRSRATVFPASWDAQQQAAEVAGVVEEAVTGVRVVKGFGQEDRELGRLERAARTLFAARMRSVRLTARYGPALQAVPALGQVAVLGFGGWLVLRGNISLGTFLAFSTYLGELVSPTRILAGLLTVGQQAKAAVIRVLEVIDSRPVVVESPAAVDLVDPRGVVELDDVTFGYVASRPVLRGVSLRVSPGETLALIGTSGSGTSTVSLLLPRFYDVQGGAIRLDGRDIRDLTFDSLRAQIGLVFEDSFLFSDSVRSNISYGRPDATDAQVVAAARAAEADGFISELPNGYDTVVGEQGLTLSGGQRQRVALARALLTDPRVLLLDDATSAVDARVEAEIHETLRRVMRDRTTLLVARRRSTLRLADRIAVLDAGRLVDVGTAAELAARSPLYRLLVAGPLVAGEGGDPAALPLSELGDELLPDDPLVDDRPTDQALAAHAPNGQGDAPNGQGNAPNGQGNGRVNGRLADPEAAEAADQALADRAMAVERTTGQVDGITPELWDAPDPGPDLAPAPSEAPAGRGSAAPRRAGGGVGGPGDMMMAAMPATPDLLARVAALPPATDVPDVDLVAAEAPDPRFSLGRLLRPVRWPLAYGLLLVALDALAGILLPALVRHGVDAGVAHRATGVLFGTAGVALAIVLADWYVGFRQTKVTGRTGERLLYSLRLKTFAQLQRLGLDYYEREMAGRIMTRMTTDVDALSTFLQTGITTAVVSLLSFFGVLVALLVLNLELAGVVLTVLPVLIAATVVFRARASRAYTESRERVSAVNADLQENLSGLRVAQAYRREEINQERFRTLSNGYRVSRLRAQRLIATYFPFGEFVSEVAAALVLGVGAGMVADRRLSAGGLIAFLLYVDLLFAPIQQLSQIFDGYQQASVGLRRLRDLLRTPTSTPPAAEPVPVGALRGEVVLDDVSFAYPGGAEAVSGVSLRVAPGETVALVGETGAGKSTVVKLVARFYDVTAGAVRIDGVDVRSYDLGEYRRRLGLVPQEAFLSVGTVRDAIAYGRPTASDAEVEAAARAVGAHPAIARLAGGYLHQVGERGRNMSAGQRQLIALARAQLVDPDILLLDEATASLDLATEAVVTRATERLARRRTTLVIAHRLTTAARADRVLVMDHGRIVEEGTHAALVAADGVYAKLWAAFRPDAAEVA